VAHRHLNVCENLTSVTKVKITSAQSTPLPEIGWTTSDRTAETRSSLNGHVSLTTVQSEKERIQCAEGIGQPKMRQCQCATTREHGSSSDSLLNRVFSACVEAERPISPVDRFPSVRSNSV
jgi:hypothetical protein